MHDRKKIYGSRKYMVVTTPLHGTDRIPQKIGNTGRKCDE